MVFGTMSDPHQISQADFAALGTNQVAYIKPVLVKGRVAYSVHAADGTPLTVVGEYAVAQALIRQNDMEPLAAH